MCQYFGVQDHVFIYYKYFLFHYSKYGQYISLISTISIFLNYQKHFKKLIKKKTVLLSKILTTFNSIIVDFILKSISKQVLLRLCKRAFVISLVW